jgi:hypothetical protein
VIIMAQPGVEVRITADDYGYGDPVAVRKPGSPDTFWAYRYELECPKQPKGK